MVLHWWAALLLMWCLETIRVDGGAKALSGVQQCASASSRTFGHTKKFCLPLHPLNLLWGFLQLFGTGLGWAHGERRVSAKSFWETFYISATEQRRTFSQCVIARGLCFNVSGRFKALLGCKVHWMNHSFLGLGKSLSLLKLPPKSVGRLKCSSHLLEWESMVQMW